MAMTKSKSESRIRTTQAPSLSLALKSTSLRIYSIYASKFPRTNINSEQRPEDRKIETLSSHPTTSKSKKKNSSLSIQV